ncbi:MAG: hypothetical protein Q9195_009332 [Heterodermia aff. obscurata]
MRLLDFPSELLLNIFKKLGGEELRRSVSYLLIYGSLLTDIIREKATQLSIRLVGHPSLDFSTSPWVSSVEDKNDDDDDYDFDCRAPEEWVVNSDYIDDKRGIDADKIQHSAHLSCRPQQAWMRRVNSKLVELADKLATFTALGEFMFEASSEQERTLEPRWDYVHDVTLGKIIAGLPNHLTALTLDTCGTGIIPDSNHPIHLCPLIAQHAGKIKTVRLRMRCICPVVFNMAIEKLAMERLTIKMSLPMFGNPVWDEYDNAKRCFSRGRYPTDAELRFMISAAGRLARQYHFQSLRISYRCPLSSTMVLPHGTASQINISTIVICYARMRTKGDLGTRGKKAKHCRSDIAYLIEVYTSSMSHQILV